MTACSPTNGKTAHPGQNALHQLIKQQNVIGSDGSTMPEASSPLGTQVPGWYARSATVLLPREGPPA
jgi:hypothetical protein